MKGIPASSGLAIGRVLKSDNRIQVKKEKIKDVDNEIKKLEEALETAKKHTKDIVEHAKNKLSEDELKIFDAQLLILEDESMFSDIVNIISKEMVCAAYAVKKAADIIIEKFENMENDYFKQRSSDIRDIRDRIIRILLGINEPNFELKEDQIIVAYELTPSDTAKLDINRVKGFITEAGGKLSHSSIMARTLGIPTIVGVSGLIDRLSDNDLIIMDGDKGIIEVDPSYEEIKQYEDKIKEIELKKEEYKLLINKKTITKDGTTLDLGANIGSDSDVEQAIENDAEGIGLFRTEFLFMGRNNLPTEDEQFKAYRNVAENMGDKPVIIRTLDIGGDKALPYLKMEKEDNPFLGERAIRFCLNELTIFKTQLRAILRASIDGNIKIMFPMISGLEELRKAKSVLSEVKQELANENIKYDNNIPVGMMIEIPSAALMADVFAEEVDFFSIGTNDLVQYTTAVDRMNTNISHLYSPFHPGVLRLIKKVIEDAHNKEIWVGICGEAAGDPPLIPVFVGMGVDELSMNAPMILEARSIIRSINKKEMQANAEHILKMSTAKEVETYLKGSNCEKYV